VREKRGHEIWLMQDRVFIGWAGDSVIRGILLDAVFQAALISAVVLCFASCFRARLTVLTRKPQLRYSRRSYYQDLSLSEWLLHTPPQLVMAHLNIDEGTYAAIPKDKMVVIPE
jgi:hypothetical protein